MKHLLVTRRRVVIARALVSAIVLLALTAAVALSANFGGDGTLVGTSGNDNINAGNGNDTVYGLGGSDSVNAGNGNDLIDGGGACPKGVASGDYPNGLPGGEYCEDGPVSPCGNDNLNVGSGNDTVWGNCGTNDINVQGGKDTVYAYGKGTINIGNGNDTVYLYDTSGSYALTTGSGKDTVYAQNGVVDTINCDTKNTTVYADSNDRTSNCTVIFSKPPANAVLAPSTKRKNKEHGGKKGARTR